MSNRFAQLLLFLGILIGTFDLGFAQQFEPGDMIWGGDHDFLGSVQFGENGPDVDSTALNDSTWLIYVDGGADPMMLIRDGYSAFVDSTYKWDTLYFRNGGGLIQDNDSLWYENPFGTHIITFDATGLGGGLEAGSGLTESSGDMDLGGTLLGDTEISTADNKFTVVDTLASMEVSDTDGAKLSYGTQSLVMSAMFEGIRIVDALDNVGMYYESVNIGTGLAQHGDNWIPNVGGVKQVVEDSIGLFEVDSIGFKHYKIVSRSDSLPLFTSNGVFLRNLDEDKISDEINLTDYLQKDDTVTLVATKNDLLVKLEADDTISHALTSDTALFAENVDTAMTDFIVNNSLRTDTIRHNTTSSIFVTNELKVNNDVLVDEHIGTMGKTLILGGSEMALRPLGALNAGNQILIESSKFRLISQNLELGTTSPSNISRNIIFKYPGYISGTDSVQIGGTWWKPSNLGGLEPSEVDTSEFSHNVDSAKNSLVINDTLFTDQVYDTEIELMADDFLQNYLRLQPSTSSEFGYANGVNDTRIRIGGSTTGIEIADENNSLGLKYAGDYSSNGLSNDRWIPDVGAVRSIVGDSTESGLSWPHNQDSIDQNASDTLLIITLYVTEAGDTLFGYASTVDEDTTYLASDTLHARHSLRIGSTDYSESDFSNFITSESDAVYASDSADIPKPRWKPDSVSALLYDPNPDSVSGPNKGWTFGTLTELDLSGSVDSIGNIGNVTLTSETNDEILSYTNGDWINQTAGELGLSATGHTHTEVDITDLSHDAVSVQGEPFSSTTPTDGKIWVWRSSSSEWVLEDKPTGSEGDGFGSDFSDAIDGVITIYDSIPDSLYFRSDLYFESVGGVPNLITPENLRLGRHASSGSPFLRIGPDDDYGTILYRRGLNQFDIRNIDSLEFELDNGDVWSISNSGLKFPDGTKQTTAAISSFEEYVVNAIDGTWTSGSAPNSTESSIFIAGFGNDTLSSNGNKVSAKVLFSQSDSDDTLRVYLNEDLVLKSSGNDMSISGASHISVEISITRWSSSAAYAEVYVYNGNFSGSESGPGLVQQRIKSFGTFDFSVSHDFRVTVEEVGGDGSLQTPYYQVIYKEQGF